MANEERYKPTSHTEIKYPEPKSIGILTFDLRQSRVLQEWHRPKAAQRSSFHRGHSTTVESRRNCTAQGYGS